MTHELEDIDKQMSAQAARKLLGMGEETFKKSLVPFIERFEGAKPKYTKRLLKLWLDQKTVKPEVESTCVRVRPIGNTVTLFHDYAKAREQLTGGQQRHL